MTRFLDFLFVRPSFLEGAARVIDFGNTLTEYNTSLAPEQADYLALLSDWYVVGDDLRQAIHNFRSGSEKRLQESQQELAGPVR